MKSTGNKKDKLEINLSQEDKDILAALEVVKDDRAKRLDDLMLSMSERAAAAVGSILARQDELYGLFDMAEAMREAGLYGVLEANGLSGPLSNPTGNVMFCSAGGLLIGGGVAALHRPSRLYGVRACAVDYTAFKYYVAFSKPMESCEECGWLLRAMYSRAEDSCSDNAANVVERAVTSLEFTARYGLGVFIGRMREVCRTAAECRGVDIASVTAAKAAEAQDTTENS